MYCQKCGKFTNSDATICTECLQKEAQPTITYQPTGAYQSPINLGKAIAAMILSYVGFIFIYIGFILATEGILPAVCIVGLVPTIIGLVFGCSSISNFKQTKYIRSGKRIPVLILGILSVVNAASGLLVALCAIAIYGLSFI